MFCFDTQRIVSRYNIDLFFKVGIYRNNGTVFMGLIKVNNGPSAYMYVFKRRKGFFECYEVSVPPYGNQGTPGKGNPKGKEQGIKLFRVILLLAV